ncbi:hypothetical protein DsansV1_C21g0168791 [Dioscorea sansibarensis]
MFSDRPNAWYNSRVPSLLRIINLLPVTGLYTIFWPSVVHRSKNPLEESMSDTERSRRLRGRWFNDGDLRRWLTGLKIKSLL